MQAKTIKDERDFAGEMALLAKLCELKPDDLRRLDAEDYTKLQSQFASFRAGSA